MLQAHCIRTSVHTCLPCLLSGSSTGHHWGLLSLEPGCTWQHPADADTQPGTVVGGGWMDGLEPGERAGLKIRGVFRWQAGEQHKQNTRKSLTQGPWGVMRSQPLAAGSARCRRKGNALMGSEVQVSVDLAEEVRDFLILFFQGTPRPCRGAPGAL